MAEALLAALWVSLEVRSAPAPVVHPVAFQVPIIQPNL
jgi:hypothetical protein